MAIKNVNIQTKLVYEIEGNFIIPSYQRGYRWSESEIERMLDDIYSLNELCNKNYCLQPIVVQKNQNNKYELIDGQQRLTTIYLIRKYMHEKRDFDEPNFSIEYETRNESQNFLENIHDEKNRNDRRDEYIDFYFMANAYDVIEKWFSERPKAIMNRIDEYFTFNVKIIWYEIESDDNQNKDAIELFKRLNSGKIELTSAELVKAMFFAGNGAAHQEEIAFQWDNIERELHNKSLWYFLTNNFSESYQTKINLVLDLISEKKINESEKNFTFFEIDKLRSSKDLNKIWKEDIQHTFLILKDWFNDHEFYHKIGYLIASRTKTLLEIYKESKGKTKEEFLKILNEQIKKSIESPKDLEDLNYEEDYETIFKLLLLFNVESVRRNGENTQWFPFSKFKFFGKDKVDWSLEHIHAKQSKSLKKQEQWRKWLEDHLKSIKSIEGNHLNLINDVEKILNRSKIEEINFNPLQERIVKILSEDGDTGDYINSVSNLALLDCGKNAALSNSTFDVKRNLIIDMDKHGKFIPFATKMIFLKYYTPSEKNQIHFWSQDDRKEYIKEIKAVLKCYLN